MGRSAELSHAKQTGIFDILKTSAAAHDLPLAYVLAVASRESDIENVLGDHGFAVGVMQVDIRFHDIAKKAKETGSWKTDPSKVIDYGINLLAHNYHWAKTTFPDYGGANGHGWLKIAASAYNAGEGGAKKGTLKGDSDLYTTGHNYGKDVLSRMAVFQDLI
ncbi:transglycosylase SLT domain-containing protein [Fimbriimonas ginsengisoli]|uniref:Transglycosylase SLT domain-containing protein n=1 Tax=Fimbriimonas ginsengisoli Gsoil 348 TaxID=661478 RepID=A0A068NP72_FIMGI|nr:transglycosylase SLT domain-containing protein [Fimbriimonas ginsengisoli]AIE85358.1 hypothetical protein OP10G_1990 [Fimbriimonas ginsengisoli Gsoil 348]